MSNIYSYLFHDCKLNCGVVLNDDERRTLGHEIRTHFIIVQEMAAQDFTWVWVLVLSDNSYKNTKLHHQKYG